MVDEDVHDVVVIGAGVAGVSAAIECLDIHLDVVLLDGASGVGGQIKETPHTVRNVGVAPEDNSGLVESLSHHAVTLGARFLLNRRVTELDLDDGLVVAGDERYRARNVLLATGSRRRELDAAPDGSFGGDVTYLVEPHIEDFAGRPAAVFGGGDSAALDALALADAGSSVFLVHRSPLLRARRDIIGRLESQPRITEMSGWTLERLIGGDRLEGAAVSGGTTGERRHLDVQRVVLKLGREPMAGLVHGQVELGRHGGVVVDASLRTSHPKAFAAGDVVEGAYERIATAMGQGSLAARSILNSLQSQS